MENRTPSLPPYARGARRPATPEGPRPEGYGGWCACGFGGIRCRAGGLAEFAAGKAPPGPTGGGGTPENLRPAGLAAEGPRWGRRRCCGLPLPWVKAKLPQRHPRLPRRRTTPSGGRHPEGAAAGGGSRRLRPLGRPERALSGKPPPFPNPKGLAAAGGKGSPGRWWPLGPVGVGCRPSGGRFFQPRAAVKEKRWPSFNRPSGSRRLAGGENPGVLRNRTLPSGLRPAAGGRLRW